jgi:predicted cupin superfamily sugar epimerase
MLAYTKRAILTLIQKDITMQELIERYQLQPHPEGGHYREVYRSKFNVISPQCDAERSAVTHIYFLLTKGQVSRFHRVLHDEIWNFYAGAPLRLITCDESDCEDKLLGGQEGDYVEVVPGKCYQAAESTGEYSLVGCSVAPGFDFTDFSFLADNDDKDIIAKLPAEFKRCI